MQRHLFIFAFVSAVCAPWRGLAQEGDSSRIDFNRDIRPILSDICYQCHGPDEAQRQGELRLDRKLNVFAKHDGAAVIQPGDPQRSKLFRRIASADPDEKMPPPDSGKTLAPHQIGLFRKWISQGARWQEHWSLIPPVRWALPSLREGTTSKGNSWSRTAIDRFIYARLEKEGLAPSPEADKSTLLRRVTLDLIGLPPTPKEVEVFLADHSPDAYQKVVDRLLDSPRYGERMAIPWLDAARFADTSGYQTDGVRYMWRWRDWVIGALNQNMPFDQFTIEQLAGDLLPRPTLDQLIATGFNRNHRANSEGGIVFEEYLVEYAVDRVDTTATVWMGLTMGCARCHDHKYDPLGQKDFYRMFAYFNNLSEMGRVFKYGNSAPLMKAPTPLMQHKLDRLGRQVEAAKKDLADLQPKIEQAQSLWEKQASQEGADDWTIADSLQIHLPLDGDLKLIGRPKSASDKQEITWQNGKLDFAPGVFQQAASFDGRRYVEFKEFPAFTGQNEFTFSAWVYSAGPQTAAILSFMDDDDSRDKGFSLRLEGDHLHFKYGPRWLDDAMRVQMKAPWPHGQWRHLALTYDGSHLVNGLKIYVDGREVEQTVHLNYFTGTFAVPNTLRMGSQGQDAIFAGRIDDLRYYTRQLDAWQVRVLSCRESIEQILAAPAEKRTATAAEKLRQCFLRKHAPEPIQRQLELVRSLEQEYEKAEKIVPTTMIMRESGDRRPTFILRRGEYDKPGQRVDAGIPDCLPLLPAQAPNSRLGLAQWLVHPSHPLTARVAVNRWWRIFFGAGLVRTQEDFGAQGDPPSHPQLLDWLATEFIRTGWDVKRLHRLIVLSAVYRQSSVVRPELLRRDPDNRLLARAPRLRLSAEIIRDQALSAAGLLSAKIGGPSVKPYQPEGLWKEIASDSYTQDSGESLYRRSMYTFWKRTVPPPTMMAFDATSREACTVSRSRTNTPLQALTLLNETGFVEAARSLAERMMKEGGASPQSRVAYGFRLVIARRPTSEELAILDAGWRRKKNAYQQQLAQAKKILTVGESPTDANLDAADLAAYTAMASLILNLDETITRE